MCFCAIIWPSLDEVRNHMQTALQPEVFHKLYSNFADQNPKWNDIPSSIGHAYEWDDASTYIQEPPFFEGCRPEWRPARSPSSSVRGRLALFGDSVTTDHISPGGRDQGRLARRGVTSWTTASSRQVSTVLRLAPRQRRA